MNYKLYIVFYNSSFSAKSTRFGFIRIVCNLFNISNFLSSFNKFLYCIIYTAVENQDRLKILYDLWHMMLIINVIILLKVFLNLIFQFHKKL